MRKKWELQSLNTQLTVEQEKLKASDLNAAQQKDLLKKPDSKIGFHSKTIEEESKQESFLSPGGDNYIKAGPTLQRYLSVGRIRFIPPCT